MPETRFINIRVPELLYRKWKRIVSDEDDSWQRIGMDLFGRYFQQKEQKLSSLQNAECEITSLLSEIEPKGDLANRLASVLRSGNERAIAIITGAIEVADFRVKRDDLKSGH